MKASHNIFFFDFTLIFLFFIIGDTITTHYIFELGYTELNPLINTLYYLNNGLYIIILLKILLLISLIISYHYLVKHINKKIESNNLINTLFLIMKSGTFFILCSGIVLTLNNMVIIIYGHSISQIIGLIQ